MNSDLKKIAELIADLHTALGKPMLPRDVTIQHVADAAQFCGVKIEIQLVPDLHP